MHITSGGSAAGTVPAQWTQASGLLAPAWILQLYFGNRSPDGEAAFGQNAAQVRAGAAAINDYTATQHNPEARPSVTRT
jgi:hypothetical protein